MGMSGTMNDMMEEKLLNLHTAFIAKVISVENESLCSVQPLDKIKAYGKPAQQQAIITKVPVLHHVRHFSLVKQTLSGNVSPATHPSENNVGHLKVSPVRAGDLVLCVCAERDITSSVKGISTTPPVGHHAIKDAVVVGLFGGW